MTFCLFVAHTFLFWKGPTRQEKNLQGAKSFHGELTPFQKDNTKLAYKERNWSEREQILCCRVDPFSEGKLKKTFDTAVSPESVSIPLKEDYSCIQNWAQSSCQVLLWTSFIKELTNISTVGSSLNISEIWKK